MATKDEILCIANQLANEGKQPTVALVKTRLATSTPLPMIISTLKSWQHQPDKVTTSESKPDQKQTIPPASEVQQAIDNALAPIKQELAEIKALLQSLEKRERS